MIFFLEATVPGLPFETTFVGQGIIGCVLLWFMWRNEKKQDTHTDAIQDMAGTIDRLSAAILSQTIVHPNLPKSAEPAIQQMINEIKDAEVKRKPK